MARTNRPAGNTGLFTHEGARAKRVDAEAQLRRTVMACLLWEDTFYEDGVSIAKRIADGVAAVPPEVASAVAVEAREQMHLRHVPLWVVREMARKGGVVVGDTLARIIQRADELSEFMALYWKNGKVPLSSQVKRGLAEAFTKFDEYQLAKYDRAREVRLRDVLFLTHPKPKDEEQAALWKRLVDGTMTTPDTWEVALSGGGDKQEHWTRLLAEGKLGGLAMLRNLRNMQEAGVDQVAIAAAIDANPFHRVLPFRFIAAARYAPALEPVIEAAMLRAAAELDKLPGRTTIVVDHSGSMRNRLSAKSDMTRIDAASGLAILLREVSADVRVVAYSSDQQLWGDPPNKYRAAVEVPARHGFALRDAIGNAIHYGGTDTRAGVALANQLGYDRVVLVTDEQSHTNLQDPLPATRAYCINVATNKNGIGYGRWTHIDGWSESVVRYIQAAEA